MKDPKNSSARQPEEGTNNDLHLTNQDVSLVNSQEHQPEEPANEEKAETEENTRREQLDRKSSPEFDSDSSYANL